MAGGLLDDFARMREVSIMRIKEAKEREQKVVGISPGLCAEGLSCQVLVPRDCLVYRSAGSGAAGAGRLK